MRAILLSLDDDCACIALPNGVCFTVSPEDVPFVMDGSWHLSVGRYIAQSGGQYLHRILAARAGLSVAQTIDHTNGDTLDNRRPNLRAATHAQNLWNRGAYRNNSTGFKGVTFNRRKQRFQARIGVNGRTYWLGYHDTAEEAHNAYRHAALKHHGSFACCV